MNKDDDVTDLNLRVYRVVFSFERNGWCVFEQIASGHQTNRLVFNTGPFNSEREALDMMDDMNEAQGIKT